MGQVLGTYHTSTKKSSPMIRKAFIMSVNPDQHAEYERRHETVMPELHQVLKSPGVSNYSIFLDKDTHKLFAYAEIESEEKWAAIGNTDACKKWWAFMKDIMPSNPDNSPISKDIREVFHMD